jgi:hypothetical protein
VYAGHARSDCPPQTQIIYRDDWVGLVLAEVARAATAAGAACGTRWRRIGVVTAAFCNRARPTADQPLYGSSALGAVFNGSVRHLLPLLEVAGAGIT